MSVANSLQHYAIIIIVVMHQKQNQLKARKRKEPPAIATLTGDVSHILRAINFNTLWKNSSAKLNKTLINNKTTSKNHKKNVMTEEDIDKLFDRSKSKNRTETQHLQTWAQYRPARDFTTVKFLKVDEPSDKLLNGLPCDTQLQEGAIDQLFTGEEDYDLTAKFKEDYTVGKIVGEGAYASVRVAIYKPQNKKVAIKVYEKGKIRDPQRKKSVRRQIKILQMLNHPSIVKIFNVVQTNNHLNIVMEYLDGIALNNFLRSQPNHRASQTDAKTILRALAEGLSYLHERQISHRDIKLENVILDENLSPKVIDFGFSTCIEKGKKVKIFCGTPSYMAPEIVQKKEYRGEPADVWALGVLAFVTLTGIFPFRGATDQELYRKINSADYPRHQLSFSKEISDLVGRMLRVNPDERITAAEILFHPWLKGAIMKKQKKPTQISECRKLTTTSSHKSREKEQTAFNITSNVRRLTETCQDNNLKLELKLIRQSPLKINSTYTQRGTKKDVKEGTSRATGKKETEKGRVLGKGKVLQLLKMGLRRAPPQDKSKPKSRRF